MSSEQPTWKLISQLLDQIAAVSDSCSRLALLDELDSAAARLRAEIMSSGTTDVMHNLSEVDLLCTVIRGLRLPDGTAELIPQQIEARVQMYKATAGAAHLQAGRIKGATQSALTSATKGNQTAATVCQIADDLKRAGIPRRDWAARIEKRLEQFGDLKSVKAPRIRQILNKYKR